MTPSSNRKSLAAGALALICSLALAACFVLPGKFVETLDIRKDGRFTYSYKGEIVVLGLTKLMELGEAGANGGKFEPIPCYNDNGDDRKCTAAEIAEQKKTWDDEQAEAAKSRKERDQSTAAMLGGIDPSDPKAGEELAERLRTQAGWNSVVYKGDGIYEIDFSVAARLDHDFAFPTIERLQAVIPFLTINRRADRSVRISSPIMDQANGSGAKNMGLGSAAAAMADAKEQGAGFPNLDGTFTLTTDAQILANNTEDGPKPDQAGQRLVWKLNAPNPAAPMALLQLAR